MPGDAHTSLDPHTLSPEMLKAALDLWGQAGEAHYLPITGGSMQPMLIEGDSVLVVPSREVVFGDVVVFRRQEELVTHRLLWIKIATNGDRILQTKGDHILSMDAPVSDVDLIGRVVAVRRGSRNQRLESISGRVIGRVMATLMRVQVKLYIDTGEQSAGWFSAGAIPVRYYISHILLRGCGLFMRASQSMIVRWSD